MHLLASTRLRCVLGLLLVGLGTARSQTTAVSNLGQVYNANLTATSVFTHAIDFTTGATGASLVSFTMPMLDFGGSPAGFSLSLYSSMSGGGPAGLVTALTGTVPTVSANYTFTPVTPTVLAGSTTYWLAFTALASGANSGYSWAAAATGNEDAGGLGGWGIGNLRWVSGDSGTSWFSAVGVVPQFSVSVIPEASNFAIAAAAVALGIAVWRRKA